MIKYLVVFLMIVSGVWLMVMGFNNLLHIIDFLSSLTILLGFVNIILSIVLLTGLEIE